ncbi:hypothetical protein CYMTET_35269 [Cymbomonas tetramitiformis]|uniref:C2H2-type domain-containing protein n=1 Tax=Cymbomonas tetramitiformis TaxID=36881 RepID=A0AAE0F9I6_9CHLO|nr:hypothetical protein CYMTET_35269 [Cymbomonas tetramitiformis]
MDASAACLYLLTLRGCLQVEYLLHNQDVLAMHKSKLLSAHTAAQRHVADMRHQTKEYKTEVHANHKEMRRNKKMLHTYEVMLKLRKDPTQATEQVHKCKVCDKHFESQYYLDLHAARRHAGAILSDGKHEPGTSARAQDVMEGSARGEGFGGATSEQLLELEQELELYKARVAEAEQESARAVAAAEQRVEARVRAELSATASTDPLLASMEVVAGAPGGEAAQVRELQQRLQELIKKEAEGAKQLEQWKELLEQEEAQSAALRNALDAERNRAIDAAAAAAPKTQRVGGVGEMEDDVPPQQEMTRLKSVMTDADAAHKEEARALREQIKKLEETKQRLGKEILTLNKQVDQLSATNEELKQDIAAYERQLIKANDKIKQANDSLTEKQKETEKIGEESSRSNQEALQQAEKVQAANRQMEKELQRREEEMQKQQQEVQQQQEEVKTALKELKRKEAKLEEEKQLAKEHMEQEAARVQREAEAEMRSSREEAETLKQKAAERKAAKKAKKEAKAKGEGPVSPVNQEDLVEAIAPAERSAEDAAEVEEDKENRPGQARAQQELQAQLAQEAKSKAEEAERERKAREQEAAERQAQEAEAARKQAEVSTAVPLETPLELREAGGGSRKVGGGSRKVVGGRQPREARSFHTTPALGYTRTPLGLLGSSHPPTGVP